MNKKIISFVTAFFMIFTLFDFPAGAVNGFTIEDDTLKNYYGDGGDVVVPDGVKHIADMAFLNGSNITSVTLPNSITSIGESAFAGCTSLTEITIPAGVTAIEPFVFDGCQNLQNVTFHDNVESIGEFSFRQCSMTSLHIPDSVKTIGANAFAVCKNLQTVNIPNGIEAIEYGIFQGCSKLSSIEIPDSVKAIGDYAFNSCEALTSVTIPDSVEEIGDNAFLGCTGLTSVNIPNSVTAIDQYAFYGCTGLTSINIPSSVTSIGNQAFYNCYALDMITYPKGLDISDAWFTAAATKVEYTVENGEVTITDIILGAGTGKTEVEIPETINGVPVTSVDESVRDKVSESGHTHKGGTATCTQKAVCALCGSEYGELAAHTGGTASCTAKAVCDVCGQEYGELAAHTLSKTPAVSPTCTAAGNKEYWTCSVCQKMFADGSGTAEITAIPTIAALPHNFVNGVCADCGEPDPDYSQPTETEPPVTEPPVTEPPVTDSSSTEPTGTQPPVTDPSDTEPTVTEPPVTDPSDTEPTVTEPPVTDPSDTEPPVTVPPVTAPTETYPAATSPSSGYPLVIPYGYTTSSNEKMFEALAGASDGDTVVIDLNGNTDIDKSVFDEIGGRDVTVRFRLKGGAYWTVNGKDIEQSRKVDLGVRMNRMSASRDEIKELAGNKKTVKFTLRHNGKFGFSGILNVPINEKYNGKYANLYYYSRGFEFVGSSLISDGYAQFRFEHASEYIIVIDDYPHGEDISAAAGAQCDDTPIDGSGHEDSGKAPAYFTDENKIRITNGKRRYRILKRRRLEDIVFLL